MSKLVHVSRTAFSWPIINNPGISDVPNRARLFGLSDPSFAVCKNYQDKTLHTTRKTHQNEHNRLTRILTLRTVLTP